MGQKANLLKTNFSSGEISPQMYGRVDITRHQNGAAELLNFVVQPHGGVTRRMGTKYVASTKDGTKKSILIPFQFSNDQAYVLEFGDLYIRFYKNGAPVLSGGVPYEVVSPYGQNDLAALSYFQSADVLYLTHEGYYPKTLARYSDTNWVLSDVVHEDGPYRATQPSDVNTILKLRTITHRATAISSVAEFVVGDVGKFIEYYDEGFLVLGQIKAYVNTTTVTIEPKQNVVDYSSIDKRAAVLYHAGPPAGIRSNISIWSSETEQSYIKVGGTWYFMTTHSAVPYQTGTVPNSYMADHMSIDPAQAPVVKATTGEISVINETITAVLMASTGMFDNPRDVGRHFRLTLGSYNVWGKITSVAGAPGVPVTLCPVTLGNMPPLDPKDRTKYLQDASTSNWKFGAWYASNYPRLCSVYQQRLIFAGTPAEPTRLWLSQSDDYVSFATANKFAEVLDNSGLNVSVGAAEANRITWLQSGPVLLVGTLGEEFQIKPSSISEALTPTNIGITSQTAYGGKPGIKPVKMGPATLFIQQHGRNLREMSYNFEIDSFAANDLTIVAEHILRQNGGAIQMAYQKVPNSVLWVVCANGRVMAFTYEKEHQVFAWTQHTLDPGLIESIAVVPGSGRDEVYFIVNRTINGATKRYVELISADFYPSSPTDKVGLCYLDCYKEYSGVATATITGLSHLEGQTVGVLADKAVHPDCVVSGGEITLNYAVTHAYVGKNYESRVKVLLQEGGSPFGTAQGKLKKITKVDAYLLNSIGLKYGRTLPAQTYPRPFHSGAPIMGQSPDLFTGYVELNDDSSFYKDGQFYIVQDQPYPLTILSVMPTVVVNE